MADMDEEDLFADLYEAEEPTVTTTKTESGSAPVKVEAAPESIPQAAAPPQESNGDDFNIKTEYNDGGQQYAGQQMQSMDMSGHNNGGYNDAPRHHSEDRDRPIQIKDDGKMFIGGLNWETTDESLKQYFTQFGDVVECTVMRDGATGRSRGFGFLTFRDPKVVNAVMVKEHTLDGKLIDPKRAIPRDEQERTAKIFVGGVSQDASQDDFANFFRAFGNVLDATLMMDKETGRPRGFGFVTFDSEAAVDRTLEGPLAICNKPIEVKRAQPRGDMREADGNNGGSGGGGRGGKFGGRHNGRQDNFNQGGNSGPGNGGGFQQGPMGGEPQAGNNMSPAMMAQYWQRMQQYFSMMQQQMSMNQGAAAGMGGMNPQMMAMMAQQRGMNPQMMQQMMASQQQGQGGYGGGQPTGMQSPGGTPGAQQAGGFNAQEQLMFEQRKYEQAAMQQMGPGNGSQANFNGGTWEGMYDDVPAPAGMQQGGGMGMSMGPRGNFNGGVGRGRGAGTRYGSGTPTQAPINAPTGPKNSNGPPGGGRGNYRGGGRGGHRGFHPYARGGGGGGG
ncbi:hypothetical protein LTR62_006639 [Meristemomyces frigidus]|uniref:RRM domain-containing protein n=1 Tax=Meristemomyces frigidus TaxID=1508187 RepID=A0AAN7TNN4_9PEZI|nr:hypothetical protein LTR62_006639 [Meristemomyces frigidus]